MKKSTYLLLRITIGISLFGHGLVRLPKLQAFSQWMVGSFEKSILPHEVTLVFSYALPIAEFTIGSLLLLGLFTRIMAFSGCLVMSILILGSCLIENWEVIPSQLLHAIILIVLIEFIESNKFSLDRYIIK